MGQDRRRPALLERVQEGEEKNIPLLLEIIYSDLMNKVMVVETQLKGRLSSQETEMKRTDGRVKSLEQCPCAVHRDPAHTCVILDVRDSLAAIRLELTQEVGKIKNRLAWWAGGFTVFITLLHLVANFWPLFKG